MAERDTLVRANTGAAITGESSSTRFAACALIFGAAVIAVTTLLALLHLRAWQLREALELDPLQRYELRQEIMVRLAIGARRVRSSQREFRAESSGMPGSG